MKGIGFRFFIVLSALLVLFGGCFHQEGLKNESEETTIATTEVANMAPAATVTAPFFRGSANNWITQELTKGEGDTWFSVMSFSAGDKFKIDMYGNWVESYPAKDYEVTKEGTYKVVFNRVTKKIELFKIGTKVSILQSTPSQAEIYKEDSKFRLPSTLKVTYYGSSKTSTVTAKWYPALDVNKCGTTQYYAFYDDGVAVFNLNVINVDNSPATLILNKTKETILKGETALVINSNVTQSGRTVPVNLTWIPALNVNKLGTTVYTVNAKYEGYSGSPSSYAAAKATFTLTVLDTSKGGTVTVKPLLDRVENGKLVSDGFSTYSVSEVDGKYFRDKNYNGDMVVTLPEGQHTLSFSGSLGYFWVSGRATVTVVAGKNVVLEIHSAQDKTISAYPPVAVEYGKALYVTGESSYLGNWTKAYKMEYDTNGKVWILRKPLPDGAQFKIIKADWVEGSEMTVVSSKVIWEKSDNHVVTGAGKYDSNMNINPVF